MLGEHLRHNVLFLSLVAIVAHGFATSRTTVGGEPPLVSMEQAAEALRKSTVTVRVWNPPLDSELLVDPADTPADKTTDASADPASARATRVLVCSGVAVTNRLLVSPIYAGTDSQIRITLPGGTSSAVRVRVLDGYSGLALIEAEHAILSPIGLAEQVPAVGNWVLSAAAWGAEQPAVSFGILGAADRTLADSGYPPLLQCDLQTAATSSGAGVVDVAGDLIGVVVAEDRRPGSRGWTYAVPVRHVQRLLRVMDQDAQDEDGVVILKRRRPSVGMVLDSTDMGVIVARVHPDSPAEKAGIAVGDHVLSCDGIEIRSVYQAVRPILFKQPGDTVRFLLEHDGSLRDVQVVLAGGVELPSASFATLGQFLQPKLQVEELGEGRYVAGSEHTGRREFLARDDYEDLPDGEKRVTAADKIRLMERALERYQQAIGSLQNRLQQEQEQRTKTDAMVRSLERQLQSLQSSSLLKKSH